MSVPTDDEFQLALTEWFHRCRAAASPSDADVALEHTFHLWMDGKKLGHADTFLLPLFAPGFERLTAIYDESGTAPAVYGSFINAYRAYVSGTVLIYNPEGRVQ